MMNDQFLTPDLRSTNALLTLGLGCATEAFDLSHESLAIQSVAQGPLVEHLFLEPALGGADSTVNRRDRERHLARDLVDAPTLAASQPEATTLFLTQTLEQRQEVANVDLKVWQGLERRQDVWLLAAGQHRPLSTSAFRVVQRRTSNHDLQPFDQRRWITQRGEAFNRLQ